MNKDLWDYNEAASQRHAEPEMKMQLVLCLSSQGIVRTLKKQKLFGL